MMHFVPSWLQTYRAGGLSTPNVYTASTSLIRQLASNHVLLILLHRSALCWLSFISHFQFVQHLSSWCILLFIHTDNSAAQEIFCAITARFLCSFGAVHNHCMNTLSSHILALFIAFSSFTHVNGFFGYIRGMCDSIRKFPCTPK